IDDVGHGDRVVPHHPHLGPELAEILHEVIGERIVVVDDEHHHESAMPSAISHQPCQRPCCASSSARSRAFALSRVSSNSAAGFESMTIPAPACTNAFPFDMITVRIAMQKSRFPAKSR